MDRRAFLRNGLALGCSAAASPLVAPVAFASAPWDTRVVVIILRGAMDGIDVVQPYGDPHFMASRPNLMGGPDHGGFDLDGYFAMHPALFRLWPLWQTGELGFIHAVSTPYRDKRSHFDGQDLLEAGGMSLDDGTRGGWLNRMVGAMPDTEAEIAYAIGREEMQILSGEARVSRWSPEAALDLSSAAKRLLELVNQGDPLFEQASADAITIAEGLDDGGGSSKDRDVEIDGVRINQGHVRLARFAADRLRGDSRIASFSMSGWDTHSKQHTALPKALRNLSEVILTLKSELGGDVWAKTAVIAMTEFGRTARENGHLGTDHGTAGAAVTAGGAIRGGRVVTNWPGLDEADLYDRRDLMPTQDVRAMAGWILRGATGVNTDLIEQVVFPGVDLGDDPGFYG